MLAPAVSASRRPASRLASGSSATISGEPTSRLERAHKTATSVRPAASNDAASRKTTPYARAESGPRAWCSATTPAAQAPATQNEATAAIASTSIPAARLARASAATATAAITAPRSTLKRTPRGSGPTTSGRKLGDSTSFSQARSAPAQVTTARRLPSSTRPPATSASPSLFRTSPTASSHGVTSPSPDATRASTPTVSPASSITSSPGLTSDGPTITTTPLRVTRTGTSRRWRIHDLAERTPSRARSTTTADTRCTAAASPATDAKRSARKSPRSRAYTAAPHTATTVSTDTAGWTSDGSRGTSSARTQQPTRASVASVKRPPWAEGPSSARLGARQPATRPTPVTAWIAYPMSRLGGRSAAARLDDDGGAGASCTAPSREGPDGSTSAATSCGLGGGAGSEGSDSGAIAGKTRRSTATGARGAGKRPTSSGNGETRTGEPTSASTTASTTAGAGEGARSRVPSRRAGATRGGSAVSTCDGRRVCPLVTYARLQPSSQK